MYLAGARRRAVARGGTPMDVKLLYAVKKALQVLGPDTSREQLRELKNTINRASDDGIVVQITEELNDLISLRGRADEELYGQLVDKVRLLLRTIEKYYTDHFDPDDTRYVWKMART